MAFDTAVSGIRAAASDLSIIGNNIANVSTTGFKASKAEFSDVFATSLVGSGNNTVGKGVTLSRVHQEFAQGNISFTNNGLDLAINGEGFFVLSDDGARVYSRSGAFQLDKDGFIVNSQQQRLQGQQASVTGELLGNVDDIQVSQSLVAPQQTTRVGLLANLDSRKDAPAVAWGGPFDAFAAPPTSPDPTMFNDSTSLTIYDAQGNPHVLSTYFAKTTTPNQWNVFSLIDGVEVSGPDVVNFQSNGQLDPASLPFEINIAGWSPLDSNGNPNGAPAQTFDIDISGTSQLGTDFSVAQAAQDGFTAGQLRGLEVGSTGVLFARYTNGESRELARVVLANFPSNSGLQPNGDTSWIETADSGAPVISTAGTSGTGLLQSGALEDSNVEITEQLVRMIVAQRNFQANAQVIQAEDAVTQTVINLR